MSLPSPLNASPVMPPMELFTVLVRSGCDGFFTFHRRTLESWEPVASVTPSGVKARRETDPFCPAILIPGLR